MEKKKKINVTPILPVPSKLMWGKKCWLPNVKINVYEWRKRKKINVTPILPVPSEL